MDRIGIIPPPKTPLLTERRNVDIPPPSFPVLRDGANTHDPQVHF